MIINKKKKRKEAYNDKSFNTMRESMIKLKFKLKTADEEDDENHTCNYSLCLTRSNPTKLFEKG